MLIKTKAEMYALYERGLFGNKPLTWDTLDAYLNSDYKQNVVLRYKGTIGGKWCKYNLNREQVIETVEQWIKEGAERSRFCLNEALDDTKLILQGEIMLEITHYNLFYSTVAKPMRLALAEQSQTVKGLTALMVLKRAMDPASYDDLQTLFEQYPTAIVEFSVWSEDVGCIPNRNTIFWEVRNY